MTEWPDTPIHESELIQSTLDELVGKYGLETVVETLTGYSKVGG